MKLILKQDVDNLGSAGEVVTVKDGYGRNFLIPTGKATLASKGSLKAVEEELRQQARKIEANRENASKLAQQIESISLTITAKAGEDGKIFGTVTTQQLADAVNEKGFDIDRRKININEDVKHLGEYVAQVDIFSDIKANLKFWVVKSED